jgi:ATP-dependent protease Clp ATPase subunit
MILGQESLCASIDEYSLDTFPKSLMLVGPKGSGKDLLIDYIAQHLNLSIQ